MEFECEPEHRHEVFVLSVRKPLPRPGATSEEHTAFSLLTLRPISALRKVACMVYSGPEYEEDGYYRRDWAVLAEVGVFQNFELNREIYTWRKVERPEVFEGKWRDIAIGPDYLRI